MYGEKKKELYFINKKISCFLKLSKGNNILLIKNSILMGAELNGCWTQKP